MKFDADLLRHNLEKYTETALLVGLPCEAESVEDVVNADEAQLVDYAANLGWDLGKYVEEV